MSTNSKDNQKVREDKKTFTQLDVYHLEQLLKIQELVCIGYVAGADVHGQHMDSLELANMYGFMSTIRESILKGSSIPSTE